MADSEHVNNTNSPASESLYNANYADQQQQVDQDNISTQQFDRPGLSDEELATAQLTLRSLVSSKEAGVIIGKAGKNVADIREKTGVKAGVSKSVEGVQDRVLTIVGTLDGVADAYSMAAETLVESAANQAASYNSLPSTPSRIATIRLLISHLQMGTIIGRQGAKIKSIQEAYKVRMVASKERLPNSSERFVEVQGAPESIRSAVWEIGKCLLEDWERAANTILYIPQPRQSSGFGNGGFRPRYNNSNNNNSSNNSNGGFGSNEKENVDGVETFQKQLPIAGDMVGCIIGRGGSKIAEIRQNSGAKITIAKDSHNSTGDRMFTIIGTQEANDEALRLMFQQLELEKQRRALELQDQQQQPAPQQA